MISPASPAIIDQSSPNFGERKRPVSMLVLHYTGMKTGQAALDRLCDPKAEVSAHYLVEEDGRVFRLVDEDKRAWHAGVSGWAGIEDVNSASIGIEIVNGGHDVPNEDGSLPAFPDTQINALIPLCKAILARHDIPARNIVGHSDIAPERKQDPGEHFPWESLAAAGIGLWPGDGNGDARLLFEEGAQDRGVSILQRGLAGIGYEVTIDGRFDAKMSAVIGAFQRRFRPSRIDGRVDMETFELVARLASAL